MFVLLDSNIALRLPYSQASLKTQVTKWWCETNASSCKGTNVCGRNSPRRFLVSATRSGDAGLLSVEEGKKEKMVKKGAKAQSRILVKDASNGAGTSRVLSNLSNPSNRRLKTVR